MLAAGIGEQGGPFVPRLLGSDPAPQQIDVLARQFGGRAVNLPGIAFASGVRAGQRRPAKQFGFDLGHGCLTATHVVGKNIGGEGAQLGALGNQTRLLAGSLKVQEIEQEAESPRRIAGIGLGRTQ